MASHRRTGLSRQRKALLKPPVPTPPSLHLSAQGLRLGTPLSQAPSTCCRQRLAQGKGSSLRRALRGPRALCASDAVWLSAGPPGSQAPSGPGPLSLDQDPAPGSDAALCTAPRASDPGKSITIPWFHSLESRNGGRSSLRGVPSTLPRESHGPGGDKSMPSPQCPDEVGAIVTPLLQGSRGAHGQVRAVPKVPRMVNTRTRP